MPYGDYKIKQLAINYLHRKELIQFSTKTAILYFVEKKAVMIKGKTILYCFNAQS